MFSIDKNIAKSIEELLSNDIPFIRSNRKIEYANVPCVIDIESSSFYDENGNKRSCMYAFVIGINGKRYIGRTYLDLGSSLERIYELYSL